MPDRAAGRAAVTPVELVLDRLRKAEIHPKKQARGWSAKCPAHEDRKPSLTVAEGDREAAGGAILNCHAGCTPEAICLALGLTLADLYVPRADTNSHGPNGSNGNGNG